VYPVKGVILAGGSGTRLRPLTHLLNKHLLPVGKYPMIEYAILKLREAGITDMMIVTGKKSAGLFIEYLGNGEEKNVQITYKIQEKPGGIAQALALAEGFVPPGQKFVVLLGDNLFADSLRPYVEEYERQPSGAKVLLKEVDDPRRYGVAILKDNLITSIEEKPEHPQSRFCVTGIYMYDAEVFDVIRTLRPSARGELEITDVNNAYAAKGMLTYNILQDWWLDMGTHPSFYEAVQKLRASEQDG
jgi:glucose-1-phosphate thymidylyltransferase